MLIQSYAESTASYSLDMSAAKMPERNEGYSKVTEASEAYEGVPISQPND